MWSVENCVKNAEGSLEQMRLQFSHGWQCLCTNSLHRLTCWSSAKQTCNMKYLTYWIACWQHLKKGRGGEWTLYNNKDIDREETQKWGKVVSKLPCPHKMGISFCLPELAFFGINIHGMSLT